VIDSLKDTQLCQNISVHHLFFFTSLGFSQVTVTVVSFTCELQATAWLLQGLRFCASSFVQRSRRRNKIWWKKNDSCLMESQKLDAES
jgi:hypothetical protein